ncbi:MAG: thiol-disulfide oxidoreductase DCC family protein [Flavisolibacter sp.]
MENDQPIILFDGVCNFCNGVVNFLIKQDKEKKLRFAALQSEAGKKILVQYGFPADYRQSFIFINKSKASRKSTAALKLSNQLPWYWKWMQIFWIVPKFLRDAVYEFVSKHRYEWFGKKNQCMVPTADTKSRFL